MRHALGSKIKSISSHFTVARVKSRGTTMRWFWALRACSSSHSATVGSQRMVRGLGVLPIVHKLDSDGELVTRHRRSILALHLLAGSDDHRLDNGKRSRYHVVIGHGVTLSRS